MIDQDILPLARETLIKHPLFERIRTVSEMREFMEAHVFAVWDFMSLLKTLQNQLTTVSVPWLPPKNRLAARLINEIVVCEESDEVSPGRYISHFELYLEAMRECGASTIAIDSLRSRMEIGGTAEEGLTAAGAAHHIQEFVRSTMDFCTLPCHQVAAAFLYGREDIIPEMFERVIGTDVSQRVEFRTLNLYLQRHIDIDGDSHGPLAKKLMASLCGNDPVKWREAGSIALQALHARQKLWDGVLRSISSNYCSRITRSKRRSERKNFLPSS